MGKGDKKRPTNKEHADPEIINELDMGSLGCKRGIHVFRGKGRCIYCKEPKGDVCE